MKDFSKKKVGLVIVLVLMGIRMWIYLRLMTRWEAYFSSDNAVYAMLSQRFYKGDFMGGFHPYWSPGFPLATVPFYWFTKSWEEAQLLLSVSSMTVLVFVVYWFFRRTSLLFGLVAAFLVTFSASLEDFVMLGGITEPLYLLLLWLALFQGYLALEGIVKKKGGHLYLTGTCFGLAYLVRTEILPIFGLYCLMVGMVVFVGEIRSGDRAVIKVMKRMVVKGLPLVGMFLLVVLPYVVAQSIQLGKLTFSGKYAYIGSGPYYALELDRSSTWAQDVWSVDFPNYKSPYYDSKKASEIFWKYIENGTLTQTAWKSFKESMILYRSKGAETFFVGVGLAMTMVGFFLSFFQARFRKMTLYLLPLMLIGLIWVVTFMAPHYRYLMFAVPYFLFLHAVSIVMMAQLAGWVVSKRGYKQATMVWVVFLFGLLYFRQNAPIASVRGSSVYRIAEDFKEIGEWIGSQNIKLIGARYEGIPYYAGAQEVYMPSEKPEVVVEYMKNWGVEYLLARPTDMGAEYVQPIADPDYKHKDLTLYKRFEDGSLIWKIRLTEEEKRVNQRTMLGY